jgi:flagellin
MGPIHNFDASALSAFRNLQRAMAEQARSLERMATAQRINRGADDPAGLMTSERLRALIKALEAESKSLQRADSVVSTADGALGEISGLLNDAEALAVANANDAGLSDAERQANQMELDSILSTIDRLSDSTTFNGDPLLDGTAEITANGQTITIGSVSTSSLGAIEVDGEPYTLANVGSGGALAIDGGNIEGAQEAISAARREVATLRGELGAFSRYTISARRSSVNVAIENLSLSESVIRDTDYAQETATQARLLVLARASLRVLSLNPSHSQQILDLLA